MLHKECLLWRQQFAVEKLKIDVVHDELHTGKIISPDIFDKHGRPVMILRPRFVVKSLVDPLEFMKSVVYMMEKCISKMKPDVSEIFLIIDFSGANFSNVDTRLPNVALSTIQNNYPRRVGQIYILNGPWFFKYVWSAVSRWMAPHFRSLVKTGQGADGLREFFDEDNMLAEMGGKVQFDFRDWIRDQLQKEGVDMKKIIKASKGVAADDKKNVNNEEPDNLVLQALDDEVAEQTVKTGYMTKLGGIVKNYKRRYFVLTPGLVRYYKSEQDVKPQGTIILERSRVAPVKNESDKPNSFLIVTPLRTYVIVAESPEDRVAWMEVLQQQCEWATNR